MIGGGAIETSTFFVQSINSTTDHSHTHTSDSTSFVRSTSVGHTPSCHTGKAHLNDTFIPFIFII